MTLHPRHYARLLIDGASPDQLAARIDALLSLSEVRSLLAELMALPTTHPEVVRVLADAAIDELTRAIVTELAITGRLGWLPAIARSVEQLVVRSGQPAVAHITAARAITVTGDELTPLFGPIGRSTSAVTPTALGGIAIQVADQRLDATLERHLTLLRSALTKGRRHE